ncbi:hypothetical protein SAY86_005456 [Trapa natans]|uniref:Pectinesterase inhibitor domain-containing protein n=1 Tax=Trapa natans TaxID=22666 RepID=A0AAN7L5M0_TRANT|nr:hypothetical protein SAY86_005456 [Trapa natans]
MMYSNGALGECETLLDDAQSLKITNIQTLVSAAVTDQKTCLDGSEEMGSALLDVAEDPLHLIIER